MSDVELRWWPRLVADAKIPHDAAAGVTGSGDASGDRPTDVAPKPGDDAAAGGDGATAPTCHADALVKGAPGDACGCNAECDSGFCVDGVCCSTACDESCRTCNGAGTMGTCTAIAVGGDPRVAAACPKSLSMTCGLDGTCDGAGACHQYAAGTSCAAGTCDGTAVVGGLACDGSGHCRAGPIITCPPFSCDPKVGACFATCTQDGECAAGQKCVAGSCGLKQNGAVCKMGGECASTFCADGVCCSLACQGGCVSCALPDKLGTCWPIDMGVPDPRGQCKDQGAPSCGTKGTCDGVGGCEKYPPETICIQATCSGTRRNTPGVCDGLGLSKPPGIQNCSPFQCKGMTCTAACVTNADCENGHVCIAGSCGSKADGQSCAAAGECASKNCVDGLCCNTACTGACRSCALASAPGKCTLIAADNVDPRGMCVDLKAASCGTNGRCDGAGGCAKYKVGTICAAQSCAANVFKPSSTCNATGQCVAPATIACSPFTCNGSACFTACSANTNCVAPNVCTAGSCGPKPGGSACSAAKECQSGFCAQGFCCDKACNGACQSCGLAGTVGKCTNVATNAADPAGLCKDLGAATCGNNGKCQAGACQKYAKGVTCKGAVCAANMSTAASTCDGAGVCVTPATGACFPFACGTTACKNTCTANADCVSPAICNTATGSCGLKGNGQACVDPSECSSKVCSQGVCCNKTCSASCQSCNLATSPGTCANVAAGGANPAGVCKNMGAASCKQDGACDGAGACRLFAAGTQCLGASCSVSTRTLASTCDGLGACKAPTPATTSCVPYKCATGSSACNGACAVDTDCVAPTICDKMTGRCGNKMHQGEACATSTDCLTANFCVDGVCCAVATCGDATHPCMSCAVTGQEGTCVAIAAGNAAPAGRCSVGAVCGNTGVCGNGGACALADVTTPCGTASCVGATFTPASHCTGSGTCAPVASTTCMPSDMCHTAACSGSGCSNVAKANGLTCNDGDGCTTNDTCQSGVCFGGSPKVCPAPDACNAGICTGGACGTMPLSGTACPDDGNPCTTDVCTAGACTHPPKVGAACADEGNPCTADVCSAGACTHPPVAGNPICDDGDTCTTSSTCQGGACVGSGAPNCNDGNLCTTDGCSPTLGCTHVNNTAACDDGDACTTGDTCGGGSCQAGAATTCDDGNACTDDSCSPATGCVFANDKAACDDGDACTVGEKCAGGSCHGGAPRVCVDGNVCTDDSCDPSVGCVFPNNTAPCDDGNDCFTGDQCQIGLCVGGTTPVPCGTSMTCDVLLLCP